MQAIHQNLDMFVGTQVTTVMLSPNAGQSLTYPSQVSDMCHSRELTSEQQAFLYKGMGEVFGKASEGIARLWKEDRVDAFGLLVERALSNGLEAFGSFRMNDVHMAHMDEGKGPYTDTFYQDHPEWRVPGSRGLNYAVPEVRHHRLAQLRELITRYPVHGLELDFLRGVPYFPGTMSPEGSPDVARRDTPSFPRNMAESSAPIMTGFVREVRYMVGEVARSEGRKIALAVRVPSSLSGCRRVGLDPIGWHKEGLLDFLSVGHFLHLFYDLPVDEFKAALPGLPVYGCLDFILGGPYVDGHLYPRDATSEIYRGAASSLFSRGADGIYLYNMFVCRGNDPGVDGRDWTHDEPVEVLRQISDPSKMARTNKLFLVDFRFELFDKPFYDVKAKLPAESTPSDPLAVRVMVGEKDLSGTHSTLRVVCTQPLEGTTLAIQVNGYSQGDGHMATQSHLFEEQYDQMAPQLNHCVDFSVQATSLTYGSNEIVVMTSSPVTIKSIELAVSYSVVTA